MPVSHATINRITGVITGVIILAGFALILSSSLFIHPNAEDLLIAQKSRDQGIISACINMLLSYDGRYFTNILHGLTPLAFGWYQGFKLLPVCIFLFLTATTYLFFKHALSLSRKFQTIKIAALLILLSIAVAPNITVHFYYYVGSVVYFLPWGFLFLWVASFLLHLKKVDDNKYFYISAILLIFANGLSEMFLFYNLAALALLGYYTLNINARKNKRLSLLALYVIYIASALFFVTSPGIVDRLAQFAPETSGYSKTELLSYSIYQFWGSYFPRLFIKHLFVIPVVIFIAAQLASEKFSQTTTSFKHLFIIIPAALVATYASTLSYYLSIATINADAGRIYNTVYFSIILICIAAAYAAFISLKTFINHTHLAYIKLLCVIALVAGIFFSENNFRNIYTDFENGSIYAFDAEMEERLQTFEEARNTEGCKVAFISPLKYQPSSIWHNTDIAPNRKEYYWNRAYERYFYLDEVKMKGDTIGLFN